jgi:hypothetical protein
LTQELLRIIFAQIFVLKVLMKIHLFWRNANIFVLRDFIMFRIQMLNVPYALTDARFVILFSVLEAAKGIDLLSKIVLVTLDSLMMVFLNFV